MTYKYMPSIKIKLCAAVLVALTAFSASEFCNADETTNMNDFGAVDAVEQTNSNAVAQPEEVDIANAGDVADESVVITPSPLASVNGDDLVTISLDRVPVNDVIRMFTRISGANIICSIESDALVTVSLYDVHWREALSSVLDSVNLALVERSPNLFTVIQKADLATEPLTVASYQLDFLTTSDVVPVARQMLVSEGAVAESAPGNIVIIKETREQVARIKETLRSIDRPVPQVFIEAKFIEMNEQAIKDLGINWQALQGYTVRAGDLSWGYQMQRQNVREQMGMDRRFDLRRNEDTLRMLYDMDNVQYQEVDTSTSMPMATREVRDIVDTGRERTSELSRNITDQVRETRSAILSADEFAATLSALQQNDGISIVSNPKIIVASAETATIHVGQKDPEVRAVADTNLGGRLTYQRQDWIESGVRLEVTPVVNTEDIITLVINPTLSRVIGTAESGDVNIMIPILSTREINTKFNVRSGQTAAIGGLTQTRNEERTSRVPVLGSIPILGKYLFTHTHKTQVQDEVVIFVTVDMAPPESVLHRGVPSEAVLSRGHSVSFEQRMLRDTTEGREDAASDL